MDVVVIRRQGHAIGRVGRRVAPIHDRCMAVIADTAAATIGTAGIVAAGGDARFAEVGLAALVELDADLGESQRWRDAVVARIAELRSRRAAAQRRVAFGIDGDEGKTVVADAGAGLPEPESEIRAVRNDSLNCELLSPAGDADCLYAAAAAGADAAEPDSSTVTSYAFPLTVIV